MLFKGCGGGVFHQYSAAFSGSMAYTIIGTATAWPSPTLTKMAAHETPLFLDVTQISWMVSLMFLGHITSPIPSGYAMDWFGRKRTCLYLIIFPLISWLLIIYGKSVIELYIARYLAGLWIGITSTIMPIYVGEISGTELRSSLTTVNNLVFNFGILFPYVVGPYVSYDMLAVACEILTVVYFCAFITMPESPHYLIRVKQREKAFEALSWLREGEPQQNIENELNRIEQSIEEQNIKKGTLKDILFDVGNRKAFVICVSYAILKRLSGSNVMQAYISVTLPAVTLGMLDPDTCVIIIGTISLASSVASTPISGKYRRRTLMAISCGGCAITTGCVAVWFYLNYYTSVEVANYSDIVFLSLALYYAVFNLGLGPIGTSIKGEIFSPNVRSLSSSLSTFSVAISSFLLNKYYLIIAQSMGMYMNYVVYSISCVVTILFTWWYVPEMDNKTLEEIQEMMRGGTKNKSHKPNG